jgi:hypothetical protein
VVEAGPDGARFRAVATQDPDGHPVVVASVDGPTSYDTIAGTGSEESTA